MKAWHLLTTSAFGAFSLPTTQCSSLTDLNLGNGTAINIAESLPAGSNFTGQSVETGYNTPQTNLPSLCRVSFTVQTSPNSSALAEVWMPEPSAWAGRFLAVGNGGFAGGVNYPDIVWGVRKGFATMSTNTGHNSTSGDGTWMLNQPEHLIDFGHRALHLTTGVAKGIVAAYYSEDLKHSYYAGCSTGGRQGLSAAQRYPDDYDGVLVGSAIPSQTNTSAWQTYVALEQFPNNRSSYIPSSMWPVIHQAVLNQCDALDGVEDGIIMDPGKCAFHPEILLCTSSNATDCLNSDQVRNLERMYLPWMDDESNLVNPGLSPGGEASFSYLMNGAEPQFGPSFYRYAVFNDSTWDWRTMNTSTVRFAEEMNPGGCNAYDPDMRAFGGKVIQYHGFADPLIPALVAPTWYDTLRSFYADINHGVDVEEFYRLFMVPGMGHCSGGVGAWVLDGASQDGIIPESTSSDHSMLWSLVDWVEGTSTAPESVIGTKYVNDTAELGVDFERPICRWPVVAQYLGGPVEQAASWACLEKGVY